MCRGMNGVFAALKKCMKQSELLIVEMTYSLIWLHWQISENSRGKNTLVEYYFPGLNKILTATCPQDLAFGNQLYTRNAELKP